MKRTCHTIAVGLLVLTLAAALHASTWDEPAAQMAHDIAGVMRPGTAALSFRNQSSLTSENVAEIRRALLAKLRIAGIRPVTTGAADEVKLTFSENVAGLLWVAEIRQGANTRVVMRQVARPQPAAPVLRPVPSVEVRRTLLWSQAEPILDAAIISGHLVILDGTAVTLYKIGGSKPELEQTLPITHNGGWPRDLRGRLLPVSGRLFDVYLPGVLCSAIATTPVLMTCRAGDDPWPLGTQSAFFGSARNFFTGVLSPGIGQQTSVALFYSAATVESSNRSLWLFAGTDGKIREADGVSEREIVGARDWGSSLAAVKTECGPVLLVTGNGDDTERDTLRACQFAGREPVAAGQPLEFAGPITALWNSGGVTAVMHNLKTDQYEAYSLAVNCSQ